MANKVIKIGNSTEQQTSTQEAYVDIDMNSKQNADGRFKIARSVNIRAIQNSLDNIFRWIPGERIINPEFGTKLRELLYEGITDMNRERVATEIRRCISTWEPRVNITKLTNTENIPNAEDNTIEIDIEYTINGLDDQVFHKQYIYDRNS